jgi:hypothetical protein
MHRDLPLLGIELDRRLALQTRSIDGVSHGDTGNASRWSAVRYGILLRRCWVMSSGYRGRRGRAAELLSSCAGPLDPVGERLLVETGRPLILSARGLLPSEGDYFWSYQDGCYGHIATGLSGSFRDRRVALYSPQSPRGSE